MPTKKVFSEVSYLNNATIKLKSRIFKKVLRNLSLFSSFSLENRVSIELQPLKNNVYVYTRINCKL